jgi:hypothetical protein
MRTLMATAGSPASDRAILDGAAVGGLDIVVELEGIEAASRCAPDALWQRQILQQKAEIAGKAPRLALRAGLASSTPRIAFRIVPPPVCQRANSAPGRQVIPLG